MDLNRIPLFAALSRKMNWLGERQRVLAQNVANADTPGYRPNDLKPVAFRTLMKQGDAPASTAPRLTSARHLAGSAGQGAFAVTRERDVYEVAPSGNAVSLEQQMAKMADTQIDFAASAGIYKKQLNMLKAALGRRGG